MRSRYEHDQNHPDSWPGENWLTDWWHGLTSPRRWAVGAGVVLAVVLALTGVAAAGGFSSDSPAPAGAAQAAQAGQAGQASAVQAPEGPAVVGHAVLNQSQAGQPQAGQSQAGQPRSGQSQPGQPQPGGAPAAARAHAVPAAAKAGGPPRTSCQSVTHIGDSTSVDLVSPASLPDAAQRLGAQYHDVGVRHVHIDASGGRSIVEEMPNQINGYKVASSYWAHGYRGCWVFGLGTNDVANVEAGSAIGLTARIDSMMSAAHGEPVLWVNTRTELSAGPWADAGEQAWDAALAHALKTYPNLRIFNWAAVAQPDWFLGDGIHYNTAGCAIRAHDIAAALARAFPATGHSASRIVT
jgi:hypothetical protein